MAFNPLTADSPIPPSFLPPDDPQRTLLHNEVHARPPARVRLPALIVQVAVLNAGVSREQECEHLRRLTGQALLPLDRLQGNFLRLPCGNHTVKWERHTEFTRYSIVQALTDRALLGAREPELLSSLAVTAEWLRGIPGRTVSAIQLVMVEGELDDAVALMGQAQAWFGGRAVIASQLGHGHSWAVGVRRKSWTGLCRNSKAIPVFEGTK